MNCYMSYGVLRTSHLNNIALVLPSLKGQNFPSVRAVLVVQSPLQALLSCISPLAARLNSLLKTSLTAFNVFLVGGYVCAFVGQPLGESFLRSAVRTRIKRLGRFRRFYSFLIIWMKGNDVLTGWIDTY